MFLSIRADASSDRSAFGDFWFSPVPMRAGAQINADSAMRVVAVFASVRILTEGTAMLPFTLYRKNARGVRTLVTDHWCYTLFARRPNAFQNPFEFREMLQGHLELRGNAYCKIISASDGSVTDLLPMHPDSIAIELIAGGSWRYRRKLGGGAPDEILTRDQVFHLRGLSSDGITGLSPIACAREALELSQSAQNYGARLFRNDARPSGWIEHPGNFANAEARTLFRNQFQEMQTGENRGKTAVLEYGMKFHEVGMTNDDAQFLETRKFQTAEIARLFRVPPHMIGDLEKATFSNIEQQSLDYVMHTLTPRLVRWEEAIEFTLLGNEADQELDVEFNVKELLRGDAKARSGYYGSGISSGWLTRNEARVAEGYDPLDGLDEPLRPLNMVEESAAPDPDDAADAADPGASNADATDEADTPPPDARTLALAQAAAARIARREAGMVSRAYASKNAPPALRVGYAAHVQLIADALAVPREAAAAYCDAQLAFSLTAGGMPTDAFEAITCSRLERLALGRQP